MTLPITVSAGQPGHISHHNEIHDLLIRLAINDVASETRTLYVVSNDTSIQPISVWSDGGSGLKERFTIENSPVEPADMDFRNVVVNIGNPDALISSPVSFRFFSPLGSVYSAMAVYAPGENGTGAWNFKVNQAGGVSIKGGATNALTVYGNNTDANWRFMLQSTGILNWGEGGGSATDTVLERKLANVLGVGTDDGFRLGVFTTAGRPSAATMGEGTIICDSDLNTILVSDGSVWVVAGDAVALAAHIADTADAHDASAISVLDTASDFTATDVEGVLAELQSDAEAHIADTSDAHDASAISFSPTGTIAATDVQAAIAEVASEAGSGAFDLDDAGDVHYPAPPTDGQTIRWVAANSRFEPVSDIDVTIKNNGSSLTTRAGMNFRDGIKAVDDAGGDETEISLDRLRVVLGTDFTTASATLVDVTGMVLAMAASTSYYLEVVGLYSSSAGTTGVWPALNGPAGLVELGVTQSVSISLVAVQTPQTHRAYDGGAASASVDTGGATLPFALRGIIRNGTTAGNLQLRWASETAVNTTVKIGTFMSLTPLM